MKKKLEAELISIAHRILKLKNKSELVQLHLETQKLYEKLSVLKFLEEQFDEVKPTIGRAEVEAKLETDVVEKSLVNEIPTEPLRMTETVDLEKPVVAAIPTESLHMTETDDIEKPIVAAIPSEPLRMTEDEFVPIAVFMPEEVSEDRGAEDEEMATTADQTKSLHLTENEFVPIAVFMPQEVSEDRGPQDEEINETNLQVHREIQVTPLAEIEEEDRYGLPAPHVPEIDEIEKILENVKRQSALSTEANSEQQDTIIRHVLPMEEIEDEIEETEVPAQEVKSTPKEISFADLLGHDFNEPVFERIDEIKSNTIETPVFEKSPVDFTSEPAGSKDIFEHIPSFKAEVPKADHSHDTHPKTITFGLNDKIGFEKHLFAGSSEEMNRVVSQLGSFNTFEEAKDFIEDMVKPDYNNWIGKEDYEQRFLEIIERRFV